jgi:hypothetical protein
MNSIPPGQQEYELVGGVAVLLYVRRLGFEFLRAHPELHLRRHQTVIIAETPVCH